MQLHASLFLQFTVRRSQIWLRQVTVLTRPERADSQSDRGPSWRPIGVPRLLIGLIVECWGVRTAGDVAGCSIVVCCCTELL